MLQNKKLVQLDTSCLRSQFKKLISHEFSYELYHPSNNIRAVSEIVIYELYRRREETSVILSYNKLDLHNLENRGVFLENEVSRNFNPNFPLINDDLENVCKAKTKSFDSLENDTNLPRLIYYSDYKSNELWDSFPLTNGSVFRLTKEEVEEKMIERVQNENYLLKSSRNGTIIFDFRKECSQLYILNPNKELIKRAMGKFKDKLPANYMSLKIDTFFKLIKKPKDAKKQFHIFLNDKKIKIERNTLNDLVMSMYLPYIDEFVTSDNHQAAILQIFFPEYINKIKLINSN